MAFINKLREIAIVNSTGACTTVFNGGIDAVIRMAAVSEWNVGGILNLGDGNVARGACVACQIELLHSKGVEVIVLHPDTVADVVYDKSAGEHTGATVVVGLSCVTAGAVIRWRKVEFETGAREDVIGEESGEGEAGGSVNVSLTGGLQTSWRYYTVEAIGIKSLLNDSFVTRDFAVRETST